MQLILRLSVVTDMVVMEETDITKQKQKEREREGNKEEETPETFSAFHIKSG